MPSDMCQHHWLRPPSEAYIDCFLGATWNPWEIRIITPTTRCKYGDHECSRCGTTYVRDSLHTTVEGRRRVARIPNKRT